MTTVKKFVYLAMLLQLLDGLTTFIALTYLGAHEANSVLAGLSPSWILIIKVAYSLVIYYLYIFVESRKEFKNWFNICLSINIIMYIFIVINNIIVIKGLI